MYFHLLAIRYNSTLCGIKTAFLNYKTRLDRDFVFTLVFARVKKKMHLHEHTEKQREESCLAYLPAALHEYAPNDWQIEYYAENPKTHKLQRFRMRVNKIVKKYKRKADARQHVNAIITNINTKLFSGWSPFFEGEDSRLFVPLSEVVGLFLSEKKRELRPRSWDNYNYKLQDFMRWVGEVDKSIFCSMFSHGLAVRFMDYVYNERGVNANTYNNCIQQMRTLFNWAKEKGYTKENPFDDMKKKRRDQKRRILIDPETRQRISEYLGDSPFLLVCMLVFRSLIRPNEIRLLKVGDVDLGNHVVKVSGDVAKNHKTRFSSLSPQIERLIERLGILDRPKSDYLFSDTKTLAPGRSPVYWMKFVIEFQKLRKALNLPDEMQLYSFRDTGIFEMIKNGVDDLSVMQLADHSNLSITSIYAKHHDPNLTERINKKAPDF